MKNCSISLLYALVVLFLGGCNNETKESSTETIKNPVGTYLDSRVDAMDMAKKSLKESNERSAEQNEQMKVLIE